MERQMEKKEERKYMKFDCRYDRQIKSFQVDKEARRGPLHQDTQGKSQNLYTGNCLGIYIRVFNVLSNRY